MTAADNDELRRLLGELRKLAADINEEEIRSHSVITLEHGQYNRQFRLDMNNDWLNAWHAELERILQVINAMLWNNGVGRTKNGVTERERDQLKDENKELRELVRLAWECINMGVSCYDCRLTFGGCTLQTAMRELGVIE